MNTSKTVQLLMERGYTEHNAQLVAKEITNLHKELIPLWQIWVTNGTCSDYEQDGYSIKGLMKKLSMQFPAALLTIDWLIKEPEKAKVALKRQH